MPTETKLLYEEGVSLVKYNTHIHKEEVYIKKESLQRLMKCMQGILFFFRSSVFPKFV